ncbi:MAG: alpha/beta hydrolase, partial [Proteobacteria bacterium]|nr:alpha/beta hydrolase [Pseudomonadota bacterium]
MLLANFPCPESATQARTELGGVPCFRVQPRGVREPRTCVLHFHGGAYVIGSAGSSLEYASRLAEATDGVCYTVDYRLAPEHPYPAAMDDALKAYRGLLAQGVHAESVILSGESSGGGLAIALAMAIRDAGLPMPAGVFAACPVSDLTLSGPSLVEHQGRAPAANRDMLSYLAASYFQSHEPTDPRVSPLFGDFDNLPPLLLVAASNEVLRDDATRLAERAREADADVTLHLFDDSVHVFPIFNFLPEAKAALSHLRDWSRRLDAIAQQPTVN